MQSLTQIVFLKVAQQVLDGVEGGHIILPECGAQYVTDGFTQFVGSLVARHQVQHEQNGFHFGHLRRHLSTVAKIRPIVDGEGIGHVAISLVVGLNFATLRLGVR